MIMKKLIILFLTLCAFQSFAQVPAISATTRWQVIDGNNIFAIAAADVVTYAQANLVGLAPTGGSTGQVLTKINGTNYNYSWQTPSGGGGGGVATVTGASVDNTDSANPVVNAIPLDATGLGLIAYGGDLNWRTSPGSNESGLYWDQFMASDGSLNPVSGSFCWYTGTVGRRRGYFQCNAEDYVFEYGTLDPAEGTKCFVESRGGTSAGIYANGPFGERSVVLSSSAVADVVITNGAGGFDMQSTTGAFIPPRLTSTERDALSPSEGWTIYNTTIHKLQVYDGSTWQSAW